jgi:membrane fusion protein, multidrug efflux system
MKKIVLTLVVLAVVGGGAWYYRSGGDNAASAQGQPGAGGTNGAASGARGRGGPGIGRTPMTVELAAASRQVLVDRTSVVGNLIGQASVDVVPRIAGRIENIAVKLGDRVARGQIIVKIDDKALKEQITRLERTLDVNRATLENRESDLKSQESTLARVKASWERGITPKQLYEDAENRYNAAIAQRNGAVAQLGATQSSLDEIKISLNETSVLSPVDGFVARRVLDPGAFAGANTVILSVVDISTVRLVANLVEKDFKRVQIGVEAEVEVDAFPGEQFRGEVSRVAPVFDPATRTATMEIEVPNPGFRLKPGMYARVKLTVDRRANVLSVPRAAIVDLEGKRGVFLVPDGQTAKFHEVTTGLQDGDRIEITDGLEDGQKVVTFGAMALRDGDRVALTDAAGKGGRGQKGGGRGEK